MSVSAIYPRKHPLSGVARSARIRGRATLPDSPPVLTVTFDVALGADTPNQLTSRLFELLQELADHGDGTVVGSGVPSQPTLVGQPVVTVSTDDSTADDADSIQILSASRVVLRGGQPVPLTRLEFDLLHFLAGHPRRVFTRLQLLSNVWGYEHAVARTVDVHIRRLRAKMGEDVALVTTVYGVGYRLADDAPVTIDRHG